MRKYITVAILFVLIACDDSSQSPSVDSFTSFEPGSFWVYDRYVIYPDGGMTLASVKDSVFVESHVEIAGKSYQVVKGIRYGQTFEDIIGDSSGFLISKSTKAITPISAGKTISIPFVLNGDTLGFSHLTRERFTNVIETKAGSFTSISISGVFIQEDESRPALRSRINYAKNVGLVRDSIPLLSGHSFYRVLRRYHIEK